jgi:hypothetical protein
LIVAKIVETIDQEGMGDNAMEDILRKWDGESPLRVFATVEVSPIVAEHPLVIEGVRQFFTAIGWLAVDIVVLVSANPGAAFIVLYLHFPQENGEERTAV